MVKNISKRYGKRPVLSDVSLEAEAGEQVAVVGRNGSGKSTLLQIMAGILKPDGGSVEYFGTDIIRHRKELVHLCGYLPQGNPLAEELSVQDNLSLWSGKTRGADDSFYDVFHLKEIRKTPVRKLSGGMKRRVSIACAVVQRPPVLIMDEPTASLDLYYKKEIRDWMAWYREGNGTIILATHDEAEIRESSRCYMMDNGRLRKNS